MTTTTHNRFANSGGCYGEVQAGLELELTTGIRFMIGVQKSKHAVA
jgi:hypothetical protein